MSVPRLRFKEFGGAWTHTKLGRHIEIFSGQSPSSFDLSGTGEVPFIKVEDLNNSTKYQHASRFYTTLTKGAAPKGSVIFPKRGAAILNNKVRIAKVAVQMDSNLMAVYPNPIELDSEYLFHQIVKTELHRIADISTIPQLNNKHINPYKIILPTLPEQQKIASFLGVVDAKIAALRERVLGLQTYKRGLMQALFSQTLRFTQKDGTAFPDWEEKRLGEVFSEVKDRVGDSDLPTFSISAGRGFISQEERFGKDISGQQNERYTALKVGDFSYNKGNSITYKYGCIYENKTGAMIAVPNVFISFRLRNRKMSADFFGKLFEDHHMDKGLRTLISSGARMNGLLNVNKDSFFKLTIPVPHPDEQAKIAEALSAMDAKIVAVQDQVSKMQDFKKGLLQQMFV